MPDIPSTGQLALLFVSMGFFLVGGFISVLRLRADRAMLRVLSKGCFHLGTISSLIVLVWHSFTRGHWLPLEDNFDTMIWLALLLALFVLYTQKTRPLAGLDWFAMPIVILLQGAAAIFGRTIPQAYLPGAWFWVHRVTGFGGAVAFGVAAASGAMYLLANHRLRNKSAPSSPVFGSLERLERLTRVAIYLGFPLLTISLITGLVRMLHDGRSSRVGFADPKVLLTFVVWAIYALVLHSPIFPNVRGRKTALLSILGFALMAGTIVAVQFMPGGKH